MGFVRIKLCYLMNNVHLFNNIINTIKVSHIIASNKKKQTTKKKEKLDHSMRQGGVRKFGTNLFGSGSSKGKVSDGALSTGFSLNAFRTKSCRPTKPLRDCLVAW